MFGMLMPKETCKWVRTVCWDGNGSWDGECGNCWAFEDDSPAEHNINFCPNCGGRVWVPNEPDKEE